jgi:hypothetical protein
MAMNEQLVFMVADTLQTTLHVVGEGIKAHLPVKTKHGGWVMAHDMKVKSDVLTPNVAAFFVQVRKNLWLYVVAYSGVKVKVIIFDAARAKISSGFMSTSCGQGDLATSIKRLSAVKAASLEFDSATLTWVPCDDLNDVPGVK